MTDNERKTLQTDEVMLKKILNHECGNCETDEFAADELEAGRAGYFPTYEEEEGEEFAQDEGIGEPDYFSTCEYTMISEDDDLIDFQGS